MLREDGERSRSHGLLITLIQRQAAALDIPLIARATSWDDYEETFISALYGFKRDGIEIGVFGDIDIDSHREWAERVCFLADIEPYHPLWKEGRRDLLGELFEVGFKATIVAVKEGVVDRLFLGRTLDVEVVAEFEGLGIDVSGEEGEYHTVVTEGPIFSSPIQIETRGQVLRDGYWFLDVSVCPSDC